jgi:hypothetical protein
MHIIPAKDFWVHVLGSSGRRFLPWFDKAAKTRGIPDREFRMKALYEPFLDHIKGRAVTSNEVKEFMVERLARHGLRARMRLTRGWSSQATYGPSWSGLGEMSHLGLLVSAGRKGSQGLWMRSADWLSSPRKAPDSDRCVIGLVSRYIERYGPVSRDDIVYWSFLRKSDVDMALEALSKDLTKESFGSTGPYFSLGGNLDAKDPPGVIILPEFDSLMMGYKDKTRFLSQERLKRVFWGLGGIKRTILLDGFVAATWTKKKERTGMTVTVEPLRKLAAQERRSIEDAFGDYAAYKKNDVALTF